MKRNYYIVIIPSDLTDDIQQAGLQAIAEAEGRTKKYFMPCNWTAKKIGQTPSNYVFRVCRTHN